MEQKGDMDKPAVIPADFTPSVPDATSKQSYE